ncbi:MAG: DUF433 domain-containing protein [Planctomycetaceae bacterium]|nr:DUF433 domain-containing protein [Planctomycetaceae bacterium]
MSQTSVEYVCRTDAGGWRISGTRVSLDSVIYAYWEGKSPEAIVEEFPALMPEQVYGTVAFYLRHRSEIDRYLQEQETRWNQLRQASEAQHGPLLDRLRAARKPKSAEEHP